MRSNRRTRDQIQNRHGSSVVDEVKRWNDLGTDSMVDFGVDLTLEETIAQEQHLATLAERSSYGQQHEGQEEERRREARTQGALSAQVERRSPQGCTGKVEEEMTNIYMLHRENM